MFLLLMIIIDKNRVRLFCIWSVRELRLFLYEEERNSKINFFPIESRN